ncbi:MAG: hypothetical protein FJW40_11300 [Acidobacteria bacterium]|nr:hypothetical protein [Acidobacteriota bacterium]
MSTQTPVPEPLPANIQQALRETITAQDAPPWLAGRISARIREDAARRPASGLRLPHWVLAGAATFALAVAVVAGARNWNAATTQIAGLLHTLGIGDHVYCAASGHYPQTPPAVETMNEKLGADFAALVPAVSGSLPGYTIRQGHICIYKGRPFIHVIAKKDEQLVSLIVTARQAGEDFPMNSVVARMRKDGIPIHASTDGLFQSAGFATPNHFAFVVSNLEERANLMLMASLAPRVYGIIRAVAR